MNSRRGMHECICAQCAENASGFKDYYECSKCHMYGHIMDHFALDKDKECCDACVEEELAKGEAK